MNILEPQTYVEAQAFSEAQRKKSATTKTALTTDNPNGRQDFLRNVRIESLVSPEEHVQLDRLEGQRKLKPTSRKPVVQRHIDQKLVPYYEIMASGILPDELVPLNDFSTALGTKNFNKDFADKIGPYRYFALAVYSPEGAMIGAVGSEVFCHKTGPATIHSSYYAVAPEYRGLGLGQLMMDALAKEAVDYVAKARPEALREGYMLQFIEANDISKMTLGGRLQDEAMAMHPIARDKMWEKKGFREIPNINYQQRYDPPIPLALKAQEIAVRQESNGYEVAAFRAPTGIPASVILNHVTAFDNLLLNYDNMDAALKQGGPLLDPRTEGLVKLPNGNVMLRTQTIEESEKNRVEWRAIDERLREISKTIPLPTDKTMQELRQTYDNAGPTTPLTKRRRGRAQTLDKA